MAMINERNKIVQILDGGLATELEKRGHNLDDDLWSARLLIEHPNEILAVHREYLDAGADIVTSSSYQATVDGFVKLGKQKSEAEQLITRSIKLAQQACHEFASVNPSESSKQVAAGVGPYGAAQADGSEYTGAYRVSHTQLLDFHFDRWHLLLSANPDLVICETIPNVVEAKVLCQLAQETNLPVWISFSCQNESAISDGTPIEDITELILNSSAKGIGLNCTPPSLISPLVTKIRSVCQRIPVLVYPNSGETYQIETRSWTGITEVAEFSKLAQTWIDQGVDVIGGCCRTTPNHIRALSQICN